MFEVKLVAQVKLLATPEQKELLKKTLESANKAADRVSEWAFNQQVFKRFDLHYQWYETLRKDTGLTAQVVALLFAKVADSYKLDKLALRTGEASKPRTFIVFVKSIGLEVLSSNEATLARSSTTHYSSFRHRRKPTIRRRQICRFAL
jgi:hypothetical protein